MREVNKHPLGLCERSGSVSLRAQAASESGAKDAWPVSDEISTFVWIDFIMHRHQRHTSERSSAGASPPRQT